MLMKRMRQNTKIIMLATAITFAALMVFEWGMNASGRSAGGDLGRVGRSVVRIEEYQVVYRNLYDQIQQSQEMPISSQQNRDIEDMAWNEVVNQVLIRNELGRRGIRVSDDEIREAALYAPPPQFYTEPAFLDENGQFDIQRYQAYLSQAGQDPLFLQQLEMYYRESIPREKLMRQVTSGIYVSDWELWERWKAAEEDLEVTYLSVDPASRIPDSDVPVTESEIEQYYRDHPEEFEVPARASVRFAFLDKTPTAADSAATLERAIAIRDEIVNGGDFAEIAARESADAVSGAAGGSLGTVEQGFLLPQLDSLAFSLPIGEVSEPTLTLAGHHLLEVVSREDGQAEPRHILIPIRRTPNSDLALLVLADSLESLGLGRTVQAAAAQLGLQVQEAVITDEFAVLPSVGNAGEAQDWTFVDQEGVGAVSPVFENETAFYMVELLTVDPAGSRSLEEASATIEQRLRQEQKVRRILQEAGPWAGELRGGSTTIEELAERLGLDAVLVGPFSREDFVPGLGQATAAVGASFGVDVGEHAGPVVANDRVILLRVDLKMPADSAAWEVQKVTQRTQLTQEIRQNRLVEWLAGLRETTGIIDNREAYFQLAEEQAQNPMQLPPVF